MIIIIKVIIIIIIINNNDNNNNDNITRNSYKNDCFKLRRHVSILSLKHSLFI